MQKRNFLVSFILLLDGFLNKVILIIVFITALFIGYSFYDDWVIFNGAKVDESLLKYKPVKANSSLEKQISFSDILKLNKDVIAWLTIDDTNIDYPIVQGKDNVDYVNTNVFGDYSLSGSIFLDYRNASDFSDKYSIVYGHHMDADLMFGEIDNFLDTEYLNLHKTGTLTLINGNQLHLEFFDCKEVDAYDINIFTPNKGIDFINGNIVALSTCSDKDMNERVVLFGSLRR